jgi:hypothetical protein
MIAATQSKVDPDANLKKLVAELVWAIRGKRPTPNYIRGSRRRQNGSTSLDFPSPKSTVLFYAKEGSIVRAALRCLSCSGTGVNLTRASMRQVEPCEKCGGCGFFGIDPALPCEGIQGSEAKTFCMLARYQAGLPLWNRNDRIGHSEEYEKSLARERSDPDESEDDCEVDIPPVYAIL